MDVKYTFRDLVVYLLTGVFCSFMITLVHPDILKNFLKLDYLQGKEVTMLIIAIPILYIFGHIIQMIDLLFSFYIVNILKSYKKGNWIKRTISKLFYKIFASTTAEYHREKLGLTEDDHILQKFYIVVVYDKNNDAGYYYLMKELFSGIKSFLIIYLFYLLCINNWKILPYATILLGLVWLKAYNSSNNYVWSLTNTYRALKQKENKL